MQRCGQQPSWEAHVQQWKEAVAQGVLDPKYISAEAFVQQQGGPQVPIRTMQEEVTNPYPENVETFCY